MSSISSLVRLQCCDTFRLFTHSITRRRQSPPASPSLSTREGPSTAPVTCTNVCRDRYPASQGVECLEPSWGRWRMYNGGVLFVSLATLRVSTRGPLSKPPMCWHISARARCRLSMNVGTVSLLAVDPGTWYSSLTSVGTVIAGRFASSNGGESAWSAATRLPLKKSEGQGNP